MKKFAFILAIGLSITTAYGGDFFYSVSPRNYSIIPKNTYRNSENMQALFAGSALARGRLDLIATPALSQNRNLSLRTFLDPYIVNIQGTEYVLVKDSKNNEWGIENIVGYDDKKDDMFGALKKLENDGNKDKINKDELKNADIRFVKLNSDGSLALNERELDFDIEKIQYIDMKNLRTALGNKNQDGTFGYFYVIIKDDNGKKAYPGRVTFESEEELKNYIN